METSRKHLLNLVLIIITFTLCLALVASVGDPANVVMEDGKVKCLSAVGRIHPHPTEPNAYVYCDHDENDRTKLVAEAWKCNVKAKYVHGKGCVDQNGQMSRTYPTPLSN